jgi:hypothetical protein
MDAVHDWIFATALHIRPDRHIANESARTLSLQNWLPFHKHMLFGVLLTMAWCLFLSPPGHALRQRASPSYNLGQCSSKHSCTSSNGWGVCKLGDSNAKRRVPGLHASRSPVAVVDAPTQEIWWKEHDDVWQEVTGKEEFWQAVNEATEEVVLVGTELSCPKSLQLLSCIRVRSRGCPCTCH